MVYKSVNGLAPDTFVQNLSITELLLLLSLIDIGRKLAVPLPCTDYLKNSFSFSGVVLWNSLQN